MENPKRLLWSLGVLLLLTGASISVAQTASGAASLPTAKTTDVALQSSPPGLAQSEPAHWVTGLQPHITGATERSHNWSGYVDTGPQFTGASGQWVVPSVQPSPTALFSATWVGVDGATNPDLIQTGTAQETTNGSTSYYAWYEILPNNSVPVFGVTPGDHMTASVRQNAPGSTAWTITITDVTSGQTDTELTQYSGPGTSAEWIEEAPTVNGEQSALANFGTAQFTNIGEGVANASSVTHTPIDMVNTSGSVIASPGPLTNASFTITDDSAGTPPAAPAATSTNISVNPASTTVGTPVTYSATVSSSSGTPTGTVVFTDGSTVLCTTSNLVNGSGSCAVAAAPVGTDTIVGTYSGSSFFAASSGSTSLVINAASAPPSHGYWLVGSDGGIFTFGSAPFYGSTGSLTLVRPVVGMTLTADRAGYWLVASDGGIFTFGDAGFFGSLPGMGYAPAQSAGNGKKLNAPIVGMVPSFDGGGYFLVGADGGVFAFGDAKFEGSCPGIGGCSGVAVTVMPDASGNGYWLVTATGNVYAFGDATTFGQPGPQSSPVTSATRTPNGMGYWILFANGTVDAFGDATSFGGPVNQLGGSATAIFATADGQGYWVTSATGAIYTFGDAPNDGGTAGTRLNGSIIAGTGF
jgi:hypothetical protein